MYNAVVQRVQRFEVIFSDSDFDQWKKENPHIIHTHEEYVKSMTEMIVNVPEAWNTYEQDIVCIIYTNEDY